MVETYAGEAESIPPLVDRERQRYHETHLYLGELNKLFAKYFNIEPEQNNSIKDHAKFKIISSNKYNVRFHNTNIRDKSCTMLFSVEFVIIWAMLWESSFFKNIVKQLLIINERTN